ncbi:hypothetical protein LIER_40427 [Lithospermum erythrorhizon]|uniref:Uncharacterized protein n=1 Tax=Lithospermum erythrorhizon TaxID=34254 RepID=A0AAV3QVL2_LITER
MEARMKRVNSDRHSNVGALARRVNVVNVEDALLMTEVHLVDGRVLDVCGIGVVDLRLSNGKATNWCRAYLPLNVYSDTLYNNLTESFNSFILPARDKPIITMLDMIRSKIMDRINNRKLTMSRKLGPVCVKIKKSEENNQKEYVGCTYIWNEKHGFEIKKSGGNQFSVDIGKRICSVVKPTKKEKKPAKLKPISQILADGHKPTAKKKLAAAEEVKRGRIVGIGFSAPRKGTTTVAKKRGAAKVVDGDAKSIVVIGREQRR